MLLAPVTADLVALLARKLDMKRLAGFIIEGTTPYGKMTSSVRQEVLRKAIYSGLPVVRVGRGNPEGFADMKDKYFLLNGRSYPDTVTAGPMQTVSADGRSHVSQPLSAIINIKPGQRALLRISDLDVSEYQTLASLGVPMTVIGLNARLLRDQAGNNLAYNTNSITLGGGESLDVILDTCLVRSIAGDPSSTCSTAMATGTYYLYTPNLDHLSNDAENFGGLMTEVRVN